MTLYVGTSGWQYREWRGAFYPKALATTRWLEYYSVQFATVEVNNAFYRLPEARVFADWAARTPEDFVVAVKASRYLTHVRRLREPQDPVHRLATRLDGLGAKRGPVLVQLPPNLPLDVEALAATLKAFPSSFRVAVEPRHPSWFVDDVRRTLEAHGAALCLTDTAGRHPPLWRTAGWGYVRFHRGRATPAPSYGRHALATWAERITARFDEGDDVYCYFNNDQRACAPRDAPRLARALERLGRDVARVPGPASGGRRRASPGSARSAPSARPQSTRDARPAQ